MKKKMNIFTKKLLSIVLALSIAVPSFYNSNVSAADINNIGAPVYQVQKNMAGTDAFVYAYNVMDYGADNTGNTDNTDIFQKLLNKAGQLGGAIVYVPAGRYKISGSLSIPKGVTLRGDWTKPTAGKALTSGTILMAYVGRNQGEDDTPFIEMVMEDGLMDMTIWYPEQTPDNIVPYSPTIRLGQNGHFGNEYHNVKNVTLVNSYIGIRWNMTNGGASPVINGVYGTPLKKGIEIDCIADVGRIDNVSFSPDYWSGSGFAGAPAKGSSFEDWIYNNGTGIVMRRNDWSYACYIDIDGYNVGYNTKYSNEGNGSTPNGHHYKFNLKNCKTGILFETSNYVGILFDGITMYNCETGIQMNGSTTDTIQFSKSNFTCSKYAINVDKASSTKVLLYDSTINCGVVNMDGGTLMSTKCTYNNKAPQIVVGSLGRAALASNTFTNGKNILNNSIYKSVLDNASVDVISVPDFPDDKAQYQSHMPAKLDLYVVTDAPYYADNSSSHGGGNDCTTAIQNALNTASANGGGIVFLPSGHYRVNGHLTIPSNVELRGATDLSTVPHGSGAIIEAYENKGNPNGDPFIAISSNAGVRGIIVNYPEQTYQLDGNGEYHPSDYPATIQGRGDDIYVINTGIRAATYGLDLDTYRCDDHYVDWLTGHTNKICVKVGNGSSNGIISNLMFNTIVYACGQESPKFGGFPNSPNTPGGQSNAAVYDQQLRELEFLIVGDTNNQTLYNCFPYGAYIGTKLINEGNGGPQNLISMGLGIDGSRKSVYFGSGLTGNMDFIDNQIVSLNNGTAITRYFETEGNSGFTANFFNTDLWGYPEKGVVMAANSGTINLITANFQQRGYNGALTVENGSKLNLVTSSLNSNSAQFSSGSSNVSVINTVADYTTNEANSFAQNIANFATYIEIDESSQAMAAISRDGWTATSNVNNDMAWQSIDGNLTTQWNSGWQAPGQWYQVDMQNNQDFDTIVTTLGTAPTDSPGSYVIKVSNDGSNWRQVASGENNNIYSVGEQHARYVRIEQNSSKGNFWAIFEFYVIKSSTYDVGDGEVIEPEEPTTSEQPTEKDPETIEGTLFTAADATVNLADILDSDSAYLGKNIGNMHLEGASFTFNHIDGGENGSRANILVHYATDDTDTRLNLSVNNKDNFKIDLPTTGGWNNYTGTANVEVNLDAGANNTLTFTHDTSGVNVDYIIVTLLDDNLAKGKSASASGFESDEVLPAYAFDGDIGTRWSSNFADDAWITVDLEKTYTIGKVVLNWEEAYGEAYNILVSTDGNNWTTVKELTGQDGGEDIITFDAIEARYVKMQGVTRALPYGYSLWEMEVYAPEEESTSVTVSDRLKIEGYQISYTLKGFRVISSIEPEVEGKKVVRTGNIYGVISAGVTDAELILGSENQFVANFDSTTAGLMDQKMGDSTTANYYAMTMTDNGTTANDYNREYAVRAYAVLEDGSIVYSTVKKYTIYKVAAFLYNNKLMTNYAGHSYLFNDILKVVSPDYQEVNYNWNNMLDVVD